MPPWTPHQRQRPLESIHFGCGEGGALRDWPALPLPHRNQREGSKGRCPWRESRGQSPLVGSRGKAGQSHLEFASSCGLRRGPGVNRQDAKAPRKAGIGRGWYRVGPPGPWRLGDLGGSTGHQDRILATPRWHLVDADSVRLSRKFQMRFPWVAAGFHLRRCQFNPKLWLS